MKRNQKLLMAMTIFKKRRSPQNVPTHSCITLATYNVPTNLAGNSRSTVGSYDLNHYPPRQIQGKSRAVRTYDEYTLELRADGKEDGDIGDAAPQRREGQNVGNETSGKDAQITYVT